MVLPRRHVLEHQKELVTITSLQLMGWFKYELQMIHRASSVPSSQILSIGSIVELLILVKNPQRCTSLTLGLWGEHRTNDSRWNTAAVVRLPE